MEASSLLVSWLIRPAMAWWCPSYLFVPVPGCGCCCAFVCAPDTDVSYAESQRRYHALAVNVYAGEGGNSLVAIFFALIWCAYLFPCVSLRCYAAKCGCTLNLSI